MMKLVEGYRGIGVRPGARLYKLDSPIMVKQMHVSGSYGQEVLEDRVVSYVVVSDANTHRERLVFPVIPVGFADGADLEKEFVTKGLVPARCADDIDEPYLLVDFKQVGSHYAGYILPDHELLCTVIREHSLECVRRAQDERHGAE